MNRKSHLLIGSIVLVLVNLLSSKITITLIAIPIGMSLIPDIDAGTRYHRFFLSHSIIPWVVVYLFNPTLLTALVCFAVGIHLILDIHINKQKMVGFYTIKFFKVLDVKNRGFKMIGLSGKQTTIWLIVNFLLSIMILLIQLKILM